MVGLHRHFVHGERVVSDLGQCTTEQLTIRTSTIPGVKTRFNPDWLTQDNGKCYKISEWGEASRESAYKARCFFCNKEFNCNNQGLPQLRRHQSGSGHRAVAEKILHGSQTDLNLKPSTSLPKSSYSAPATITQSMKRSTLECTLNKDSVTKTEFIWSMKVVFSITATLHVMTSRRHCTTSQSISWWVLWGYPIRSYWSPLSWFNGARI